MRDIGLIGRAGTGKTTLAQEISRQHQYVRLSIADGLRDLSRTAHDHFEKGLRYPRMRDGNVELVSGRELLIELGHALRSVDSHFLLRQWLRRREGSWYPTITDDIRLDAEVDFIRAWRPDTLFVRLVRPTDAELQRWQGDITERQPDQLPAELVLDTSQLSVRECIREIMQAAMHTERERR